MKKNNIKLNYLLLKVIDVLLLAYPIRTSIGVVLGLSFSFFSNLFQPFLANYKYINTSAFSTWGCICIGVLLVHLPSLFSFFKNKPYINEQVDEVIKLIESGSFTDAEKRQHYRLLLHKVLENITFQEKTQTKYDEIKESLR